jgi:hypothetical protein
MTVDACNRMLRDLGRIGVGHLIDFFEPFDDVPATLLAVRGN